MNKTGKIKGILMSDATENAERFPSNVRNAKHSVVANEYTRNCERQFRSIIIKSFIIIAVIMMLLSVMQGEGKFYMHKIHSIQKGEYYEYSVS